MPLVSIREYARMRGVSHNAVRKAIESKRLIHSVVQSESGKKLALIDSDLADQEWPKGTQEQMKSQSPKPEMSDNESKVSQTYAQSRAAREAYAARLAKLEYEHKSGKLVEAARVESAAFKAARFVRDAMLNIPDRVSTELAAEENQFRIHQRLTEEIRKALEGLEFEGESESISDDAGTSGG